jgi:hypothetical protein
MNSHTSAIHKIDMPMNNMLSPISQGQRPIIISNLSVKDKGTSAMAIAEANCGETSILEEIMLEFIYKKRAKRTKDCIYLVFG